MIEALTQRVEVLEELVAALRKVVKEQGLSLAQKDEVILQRDEIIQLLNERLAQHELRDSLLKEYSGIIDREAKDELEKYYYSR